MSAKLTPRIIKPKKTPISARGTVIKTIRVLIKELNWMISVATIKMAPHEVIFFITSFIRFEVRARLASTMLPINSRWVSIWSITRSR